MSDEYTLDPAIAGRLSFGADGLIPAIAQDLDSGRILMMAWMDESALAETLATGRGVYYSRSRAQRWVKGETSGHTQRIHSVEIDCDGDTLVLAVEQQGPACHTGSRSCFDTYRIDIEDVAD